MRQENKVIGRLGSYEVILNARSDEMLSLKALDKSNVNGVSDDVHLRAVENLRSIWPSHHLSEGAQKSNRLSEKGLVEYLKPSGYYTDKETGKSYKVRFTIKRIKNEDALRLYSIELAPLTGLADVIFDIVQSGGTLRANGLVVLEEVFGISARLVANNVSLKTHAAEILPLIDGMKAFI